MLRGTRNRDGGAIGVEQLRRGRPNLLERHRPDVVGQAPIVIESKAELLFRLQERRDSAVGLERPRNRANQELLGLRQLLRGRPIGAHRPHLLVDSIERSSDVIGIDAGAHDQRSDPHAGIERAKGVVGHALTFADVVSETSTESELPEDIVHHEVRIVSWVEATDGGEPVGDFRL